ncbi:hypothetical protein EYF80_043558 [Liparis tanakae]|uniref:Uncharacterized protein n=1 Tax=Liparis tanakae TaxID=230148 RepID=A0A4Z2FZH9_9TELE|nr:hypothetical protein EYF80_043558 [Liparis tanakae]
MSPKQDIDRQDEPPDAPGWNIRVEIKSSARLPEHHATREQAPPTRAADTMNGVPSIVTLIDGFSETSANESWRSRRL